MNFNFGGNHTSMFIGRALAVAKANCVLDGTPVRAGDCNGLLWLTVAIFKQTKKNASFRANIKRLIEKGDKFFDGIDFRKHRI